MKFLLASSSDYLVIVSRIFFTGDASTSFTVVSQLGAEAAVLVYFERCVVCILKGWCDDLSVPSYRAMDYGLACHYRGYPDLHAGSGVQR